MESKPKLPGEFIRRLIYTNQNPLGFKIAEFSKAKKIEIRVTKSFDKKWAVVESCKGYCRMLA